MIDYSAQKERINAIDSIPTIKRKIKELNIQLSLLRSRLSALKRIQAQKDNLQQKADALDEGKVVRYKVNRKHLKRAQRMMKSEAGKEVLKRELSPLEFHLVKTSIA